MNMQRPGFLVSCDKKSLPPARVKEVACLRLQVSLLVFSDENNIHSKMLLCKEIVPGDCASYCSI